MKHLSSRWASLHWRLALSYAGIALLTTLSLGILLLTILQQTYRQQELTYLTRNAETISEEIIPAVRANDQAALQSQLTGFAFLSQTRIEVLAADRQAVLADSGDRLNGQTAVSNQPSGRWALGLGQNEAVQIVGETDGNVTILEIETEDGLVQEEVQEIVQEQSIDEDGTVTSTQIITRTSQLTAQGTPFGFGLGNFEPAVNGRSRLQVEYPLLDDTGALLGVVRLSQGPAYGRDVLLSVATSWGIASLLAILLAALVGGQVSRRLTRPLLELTAVSTQMADGDLTQRVAVSRQDELGQLGGAFNQMADRVEETVQTLRQFVADAAHELNTPLTALQNDLSLLEENVDVSRTAERARRAKKQTIRLQQITESLLDLSQIEARANGAERPLLALLPVLQTVGERYASQAEQSGIQFSMALPETAVWVRADPAELNLLLGNLLENSLKFTNSGGKVELALAVTEDEAQIRVQDTGIGIPPEDLPFLTKRFRRGRNVSDYPGSGLGLAIAHAVVVKLNGRLAFASDPAGTRVTLTLPLASSDLLAV